MNGIKTTLRNIAIVWLAVLSPAYAADMADIALPQPRM